MKFLKLHSRGELVVVLLSAILSLFEVGLIIFDRFPFSLLGFALLGGLSVGIFFQKISTKEKYNFILKYSFCMVGIKIIVYGVHALFWVDYTFHLSITIATVFFRNQIEDQKLKKKLKFRLGDFLFGAFVLFVIIYTFWFYFRNR